MNELYLIFIKVGVATLAAGKWTPICMMLVIVVSIDRCIYNNIVAHLIVNRLGIIFVPYCLFRGLYCFAFERRHVQCIVKYHFKVSIVYLMCIRLTNYKIRRCGCRGLVFIIIFGYCCS